MSKKSKKIPSAPVAGGTVSAFVKKLSSLLEERYGRRIPAEYQALVDVLSRPQDLTRKDKNSPLVSKTYKDLKPERLLEELVDSCSPEEILMLIPDTVEETKELNALINGARMGRDEDTIWRKITGYAHINRAWIRTLAGKLKGKKCLEIMAGNGLLSYMLQEAGASVMATDIAPDKSNEYISMRGRLFTDVTAQDAVGAVRKYGQKADVLIVSWPPQGGEEVLKAWEAYARLRPDGQLLYIGEARGGFNATDAFFDTLEEADALEDVNRQHLSLPGSKDRIGLYTYRRL